MASQALILAAQTNGRKSQGPKTPEGKRKSSANSHKHGLYGKDIRTDAACEAYRQRLLAALVAKYQPTDPTEQNLVETIALAGARQDWAIRTSETYIAEAIAAQANPEAPYQHPGRSTLMLLHRLETRYCREETRAREQLLKICESKMKERTVSAPVQRRESGLLRKCAHELAASGGYAGSSTIVGRRADAARALIPIPVHRSPASSGRKMQERTLSPSHRCSPHRQKPRPTTIPNVQIPTLTKRIPTHAPPLARTTAQNRSLLRRGVLR